jgi:hypothetical protein
MLTISYSAADMRVGLTVSPSLPTKLAQCEDGLPVWCSVEIQILIATEARCLERPQASSGLATALPVDSDLTTTGATAVHPLLCFEYPGAWVFVARSGCGFLLW